MYIMSNFQEVEGFCLSSSQVQSVTRSCLMKNAEPGSLASPDEPASGSP